MKLLDSVLANLTIGGLGFIIVSILCQTTGLVIDHWLKLIYFFVIGAALQLCVIMCYNFIVMNTEEENKGE